MTLEGNYPIEPTKKNLNYVSSRIRFQELHLHLNFHQSAAIATIFFFTLVAIAFLVLKPARMSSERMLVKKLTEFATIPKRGSEFAAGFDLSSAYDVEVPARGKALVKTDISIAIPPSTYARIAPRSGLAWKNFIDTGAGVIDYDYRGNVGVILFNHSDDVFQVKRGDRIAQLILERISMAEAVEVDELQETVRGEGGFGSTGIKAT